MIHRKALTFNNKSKRRLKRPPPPKRPLFNQMAYLRFLREVVKSLEASVNRVLIPRLSHILSQNTAHHPVRSDSIEDDLDAAFDTIDVEFEGEYAEEILINKVKLFAQAESDQNLKSVKGTVKKVLGIDIFLEEPYLKEYIQTFALVNSRLITKMKDDTLNQISQKVFEAFRSGTRSEDLSRDIQDRFGVAESKADLIARDQMTKLNGGLDRLRQQEIGVERYTWRGTGDNRERDSHLENNDKVFSWDDPPVETGNPGDDINCRCYAEPFLADILGGQDEGDAEAQVSV
jgi:SPP1 gp7 family putative phage head morphogenesis protein